MSGLSGAGQPVRVVLADDNVLLREGVAGLLERHGFEVAGQAGDAPGLLALVREQRPDLAVTDIRMPPGHSTDGLDAALAIREEFPHTGIVVLSAFVHPEHAVELLSSGQRIGYLLKDRVADVTEFVQSLRRVAGGGMVIDPALVRDLVRARRGHDPFDVLSAREREVLALMAEGRSNAGIARQIWVAEGTVEKHVHSTHQLRTHPTEVRQPVTGRVSALVTLAGTATLAGRPSAR